MGREVPQRGNGNSCLYLDLGLWSLRVVCLDPEVLCGLRSLFRHRCLPAAPVDTPVLTCEVTRDPASFQRILRETDFNGPEVRVSEGIVIRYAGPAQYALFHVTDTAILELDTANPMHSRAYLDPVNFAMGGEANGRGRRSEPEAFFYPLLAEWIRSFDACLMHCGAAVFHGRAVVLTGAPGSGKSTHLLRLVHRGARFLADDLAILHRAQDGLCMLPLREVANVGPNALNAFPELAYLRDCATRGDGKYTVSIPERYGESAWALARPGTVVRLLPGREERMSRCPPERLLDGMHNMAWFASAPERNSRHFWLLADWLLASVQWQVTQGYLARHIDRFVERMREELSSNAG